MSKTYPAKHLRLNELRESGLNIADFIYFPIAGFDEETAKKLFEKYSSVSVRTFAPSELLVHATPVKYEMTDFKVVEEFCKEQNREYNLLMNQAINLKDALITGKIAWINSENFHVDYFYGPGTPRYMDEDRQVALHTVTGNLKQQTRPDVDERILEVVEKTKTAIAHFRPIIFEFQIYPYEIGVLKQKTIFWEWLSFGGKQ